MQRLTAGAGNPRTPTRLPHINKLEQRLEPEILDQIAHDYEAGSTTIELMSRYGLGKGTVIKLLHDRGVPMRRQGLSEAQIKEAMRLYADGWSLARLGQRYDCAHTVVRKALLNHGVRMRARPGWSY